MTSVLGVLLVLVIAGGSATEEVWLRGEMICLDEMGQEAVCSSQTRYALRDAKSGLHRFEANDPMLPMFADARVRAMDLEIHAWIRDEKIEIVKVYSHREGRKFHVHYFCEVCNITSYSNDICWCCQQPVELRETPVG